MVSEQRWVEVRDYLKNLSVKDTVKKLWLYIKSHNSY